MHCAATPCLQSPSAPVGKSHNLGASWLGLNKVVSNINGGSPSPAALANYMAHDNQEAHMDGAGGLQGPVLRPWQKHPLGAGIIKSQKKVP